MKTPEEVIAKAYLQSWDPHIGSDGATAVATAVLNALDADYVIIPKTMWFRPDDGKPSDVQ